MALTEKKIKLLVSLLNEMEWPLDSRIFHALLQKVPSVPNEFAVLDDQDRMLTFYRKDHEYDGHHMPGTVLRNNETVRQALSRLMESEVVGGLVGEIRNIGWTEIPKGNGPGENPTRHEISLLWLARLRGPYKGKSGIFSPFDDLPANILPHHRVLAGKFRRYLETGKPILGD